MNCEKAKLINLASYLKEQGFKTKKSNKKVIWFYSPFRVNERTPSFKVDLSLNVFHDFGEGIGGTIIDFIMRYNSCSIKEALAILSQGTFTMIQPREIIKRKSSPNYSINKTTELTNPKLLDYLTSRKINLLFAKQFCVQVYYSFSNGKEFYGIGFKNDVGGFEIVNIFSANYRKISLGKKEITTVNNNSNVASFFESWSDFLSYLTLKKGIPKENFIILNSTSLVNRTIELLDNYTSIKLFFDNDQAGEKATNILIDKFQNKIIDNRIHYKKYNDLNDYLMREN